MTTTSKNISVPVDSYICAYNETMNHIDMVRCLLMRVTNELQRRAVLHDMSKLESPEVEIFSEYTPKLRSVTYGSPQYKKYLEEMSEALRHHYSKNRHHPEHFMNGIEDMNLVDILEMVCDWKASTKRHADGDILKSLEINKKRFKMSPQLCRIIKNTLRDFKMLENSDDEKNQKEED